MGKGHVYPLAGYRLVVVCLLVLLSGALFPGPLAATEWNGAYFDGRPITRPELSRILDEHQKWRDSGGQEGSRAALADASLAFAELAKADLSGAVLSGADFTGADLAGAVLRGAQCAGIDFYGANLAGADLNGADLSGADCYKAVLSEASLKGANLTLAILAMADLSGADLSRADLGGADLSFATLDRARLYLTRINGARLYGVSLSGAEYSCQGLPETHFLSGLGGLSTVTAAPDLHNGLAQLRQALRDTGQRDLEREATYALERTKTTAAALTLPERWFRTALFDWTCGYGLNYCRPLCILLAGILVFAPVYWFALWGKKGPDGVYLVRPGGNAPQAAAERLQRPLLQALPLALGLSLVSALHFGWRGLNAGCWLAEEQPEGHTLQASGWVRCVSRFQSLLTIYLLALWAVACFGRPFE